ncbi:MAG: hypothetical protein UX13_C0049G0010 [Candidatus Woesebacteria bacterium GW2011_GWB1_45_5]|uniref:DUF2283 domain-containing protein n=1 Tax=Candidatus Woesebacteria bacterium GW2011_GWB1_45_5 TaxID=1618581 RepID=A0A0G1MM00_9BACT|nr:MAG: hypothetical protein UX13_C0049G0010 [Candidatus Woesebacteria bacterium GW2011_GWB1_45_5]
MKIKYDKKVDAIYIEFSKGTYSRSRKVSDSVLVDEDKGGKILGVEILDAKENVKAFDPAKVGLKLQVI